MKISRIVDIHLFFKSNGRLSNDYYNKYSALDKKNTIFYSTLSTVIATKKRYGIVKATIDELVIPKEMWDEGIWEKAILIRGTGLCDDTPEDIRAIEIEFAMHTGCNTSLLTSRNIDFDEELGVMKVANLDVSIDCNTITFSELE